MDIKIGKVILSGRQFSRMHTLAVDHIKGFARQNDEITVVSLRELSDKEIDDLKAQMLTLPDTLLPQEIEDQDFQNNPFRGKTPDQVEQYVLAQITDLASAKVVISRLARALAYVVRKGRF